MKVYVAIIAFLYISSFIDYGKFHKYLYWLAVFILAIVSGTRYYVGTDFAIQINYYNWTIQGNTSTWLEPGFRLYIHLIDSFFGNFQWFIFIASIFVTFSFGYIIYKRVSKKNHFFSLALFVVSTIYFATMNLERQYIAIAFLIYGYESIQCKRYVKAIFFLILAVSFHMSAMAFVITYILYFVIEKYKNYTRLTEVITFLFIVAIIGGIIDIRGVIADIGYAILPEKYAGYLTSRHFLERNWAAIIKMIVPFVVWIYICFGFSQDKKNKFKEYLPLYIPWFIIDAFFGGVNVLLRIGMYFEWILILVYPTFVECFNYNRNRILIKNMLFLFYFLLTSYSIFLNGGHGVVPYQSILVK